MTTPPDSSSQAGGAPSDLVDGKSLSADPSETASNGKPGSNTVVGKAPVPNEETSSVSDDSEDDGPSSSSQSPAAVEAEKEPAPEAEKEAAPNAAEQSASEAPPLPDEPVPEAAPQQDDGWECMWSQEANSWYFYNRITQQTQWDNPRVPAASGAPGPSSGASAQPPLPPAGTSGYNPAIHGDFDPTADYAQGYRAAEHGGAGPAAGEEAADPSLLYISGGFFNRATGQFQRPEQGTERHNDEAKSQRQMGAFFDVDAAANSHDGRSLKAERSGKKPSKKELKAFKEKRRARKEEKRRAWLRD